jgi:filamentous hemagglutinin
VAGGDILLWSSEGDLDAGKGKRTAVNVPPPIITLDKNGNVVVTLQGAATGSGIGALGESAGNVDLLAPKGTIDAGDAGIRAKNVNLAAQTVLNAANITATGSASGTQVATAGALNGTLTGAAGAGDPSKAVSDAVKQATQAPAESFKKPVSPSFINVEVVSIGD